MQVSDLNPKEVWSHFVELNKVPRPSKKEQKVIKFMLEFGKRLGLPTERDEVGNVLITKPATSGMEDRKTVVLQSHLDMVHQKNSDTVFDFDNDPINSYIDGEWVTADGTTLGADNGIAVAASMAVLESKTIVHPAIEAIFTIDEETGMTGAFALKPGWLKGEIMLNMDYEDEGELCIGCAGGIDNDVTLPITREAAPVGSFGVALNLTGLKGGHSGVEIHLQRGNANKAMARLVAELSAKHSFRLSEFDGGSLRNAIPREAFLTGVVPNDQKEAFHKTVEAFAETLAFELRKTDPNLKLEAVATEMPVSVLTSFSQFSLTKSVNAFPNGVYKWSNDMEGLVETSTNLARIKTHSENIQIQALTRGSLDSGKLDLANSIKDLFELAGAEVDNRGDYPGWNPNPDSEILAIAGDIYNNLFDKIPEIKAIHAGLECGIIMSSQTQLDSVSFGPTIRNPHSPDEKINIATVEKFWTYLLELLKRTPTK